MLLMQQVEGDEVQHPPSKFKTPKNSKTASIISSSATMRMDTIDNIPAKESVVAFSTSALQLPAPKEMDGSKKSVSPGTFVAKVNSHAWAVHYL